MGLFAAEQLTLPFPMAPVPFEACPPWLAEFPPPPAIAPLPAPSAVNPANPSCPPCEILDPCGPCGSWVWPPPPAVVPPLASTSNCPWGSLEPHAPMRSVTADASHSIRRQLI